jgi:hypothetical protein
LPFLVNGNKTDNIQATEGVAITPSSCGEVLKITLILLQIKTVQIVTSSKLTSFASDLLVVF